MTDYEIPLVVVGNSYISHSYAGRGLECPAVEYGKSLGADAVHWLYWLVLKLRREERVLPSNYGGLSPTTGVALEVGI